MHSKSFLIAVAAFAVTATGVHAYGGSKIINRAGLTEDQITAITEAQALRADGDLTSARDKLLEAGIDEQTLWSIHQVARASKVAVRQALDNNDYQAFKQAVVGLPLEQQILSEIEFDLFRKAHLLKIAGQTDEANDLLAELGVDQWGSNKHRSARKIADYLTPNQHEALRVARSANDRATVRAILEETDWEGYPR